MVGKTISHYRILEKLGGGGMGVVYKAEDTQLGRFVALKFLPEELAQDRKFLERFRREARAASALDHPNICTVYDIGEHNGTPFLVMACLEGQTLRQRLAAGGLKTEEVLELGIQIADGLDAAHAKGIVHRDVKPANIFVTTRGQAKILDFGLAKWTGAGAGLKHAPSGEATAAAEEPLTTMGMAVGTVEYMSPEQVRAEELDARTDLFSFGVVLYEMATGRRAFAGDSPGTIFDAILHKAPTSAVRLNPECPAELEHIINKALEKDREVRYQSASELRADLKRLKRDSDSGKVAVSKSERIIPLPRSRYGRWIPGLSLAALLAFLAWYFWRPTAPVAPPQTLQPVHRQITFVGDASSPAISPDGSFVAYVVGEQGVDKQQKVMVQDLTGGQPIEVFKVQAFYSRLRWSPDGSKLALIGWRGLKGGNAIYVVPRLGGEPRHYDTPFPYSDLCWSPDGSRIAGATPMTPKQLHFLDVVTGEQKSIGLSGTFDWAEGIDWSPTDTRLLFLTVGGGKSTVWTIKTDGSQQKEAFSSDRGILSPQWSPNGETIYYMLATNPPELWKTVLSAETGKPLGPALQLLAGLEIGPYFTVSRQNARLLCTRVSGYNNLWLATASPRGNGGEMVTKALTSGTSSYGEAQISPDGKQIAFSKRDPGTGSLNLFVMPIEGGPQRQITFLKYDTTSPAWSPDGTEIAFCQWGEKGVKVGKVSSAGGVAQEFADSEVKSAGGGYVTWSPGSKILYQRPGNRNFQILDPITKKEEPLVKDDSVGWMFDARYTADGGKVVVFWNRTPGGLGLWIISLKDSSETLLPPLREKLLELDPVIWSKDGRWVYAVDQAENPYKILLIQVQGARTKTIWTLPKDASFCSMTSDGQRIVYLVSEGKSDVWLIENFDRP